MKISMLQISNKYDGKKCFVHSRLCPVNKNDYIMTTQYLNVAGSDTFDGLLLMHSHDGGATWTKPAPDKNLSEYIENNVKYAFCDATHLYHKKTGKIITIGVRTAYTPDGLKLLENQKYESFYAVYDEESKCYEKPRLLPVPDNQIFERGCMACCVQFTEAPDGDILVPLAVVKENGKFAVTVIKLSFDGEALEYISSGGLIEFDGDETSRGLYEPSLCCFNGKYYLTIRNDNFGFWAVSDDGESFSEPEKWCWDTGFILPTYNTQSHWLLAGNKLFLVYTRRSGCNDHVFRNRAPLFVAEVGFNGDDICILRATEQIAVPERGARLGNFGVTSIDGNKAVITVSEWMQPEGCEKYGSDNSFWLSTVEE